jgi:beta-RFAP synthase
MDAVRLTTPSRLHFGLLAWGARAARQFGGVGLLIEHPGLRIVAERAPAWSASGPLAARVQEVARSVHDRLRSSDLLDVDRPLRFQVERAAPAHVGLGTGTQLCLAVARAVALLNGGYDPPTARLATWTGRGKRSGIGLHGHALGGLIVDGGRSEEGWMPPLLAHHRFPDGWSVLVVIPPDAEGLHGHDERTAFATLPAYPDALTDRLSRLVLLDLLPAVAEKNLHRYGLALEEIQQRVGACFAPFQGGRVFAHPMAERMVSWLRSRGLQGVGQSSWGPTLYGFTNSPLASPGLVEDFREAFDLAPDHAFWTTASGTGAVVEPIR